MGFLKLFTGTRNREVIVFSFFMEDVQLLEILRDICFFFCCTFSS